MFNWMVLYPQLNSLWARFASVRFDMKVKEDIEYHEDSQSFNASLVSHPPDPSLGFQDETTGSDVFDYIENYLDDSPYSLCGSFIIILVKRLPNTVQFDGILKKLRDNHVFVYISMADTPSGGSNPAPLFDVAYKTNGMCLSNMDTAMQTDVWEFAFLFSRPYQFLSKSFAAAEVSSDITPFQTANSRDNKQLIMISIIFQNHNRDENFKNLNFTVTDNYGNTIGDGPYFLNPRANSYTFNPVVNNTADYTLNIDYEYGTAKVELLQIKMYQESPTDWLPLP